GVDERTGRNSLSVALSAVRKVLEPPGTPDGSIVVSDRFEAGLSAEAVVTDVGEFEALLDAARRSAGAADEASSLERALSLYAAPLLPGYYEEWVEPERERLGDRYFVAVSRLAQLAGEAGDLERAIT